MSKKLVDTYFKSMYSDILKYSRSMAILHLGEDESYRVTMPRQEIKKNLELVRLHRRILERLVSQFSKKGITAEIVKGGLVLTVLPLMSNKETYTIEELLFRSKLIDDINAEKARRCMVTLPIKKPSDPVKTGSIQNKWSKRDTNVLSKRV